MPFRISDGAGDCRDSDNTVEGAVPAVGLNGERRGVAVAVDGEVVRNADWDSTRLSERQAVEVVRAVQGG